MIVRLVQLLRLWPLALGRITKHVKRLRVPLHDLLADDHVGVHGALLLGRCHTAWVLNRDGQIFVGGSYKSIVDQLLLSRLLHHFVEHHLEVLWMDHLHLKRHLTLLREHHTPTARRQLAVVTHLPLLAIGLLPVLGLLGTGVECVTQGGLQLSLLSKVRVRVHFMAAY